MIDRKRESADDGNSAARQRRLGEYIEQAHKLSDRYYAAVQSGAITLQQAIYALTHDLAREWRRVNGRQA
jgi:hypothetical protein